MELIKDLGVMAASNNIRVRHGLFLCGECHNTVTKRMINGKDDKSCGCAQHKKQTNLIHGCHGDRIYIVWAGMKARCNKKNKNFQGYKNYAGRGIKVCEEWKNFVGFRDWAFKNGYKGGLQIDRKDNNGNYKPSNCRFTTSAVNNQNRRNNKLNWVMVDAIRDLYMTGKYKQRDLGDMFCVDKTHISGIILFKTWNNISGKLIIKNVGLKMPEEKGLDI